MNRKLQNAAFKLIDVIMILTMLLGMPGTVYAAPQAQDATPVLATVDADYAPGESAQITGSGFSPGGNYTLTALGPDSVLVDWASVTADSDGNFAADSPALSSAGSYLVSAFAADNMLAATVSFTVTAPPTEEPTQEPTATEPPTEEPTQEPTATEPPTAEPTQEPTQEPTATEPPTEPPTATSTPEPTSSPTPSGPPTIVSDKADYIAGEHVTLTGENWQGDTEVRIIVNDDIGQTWRRDVTVTVGADGTIYDSFNLPTFFVANYSVTARGQQTNRVATTSFTDAPPDLQNLWQCDPPTGYNPSTYTCATSAATGWVTGNNDGPFKEGETIPYRTRMQNLVASNQYSVTIEWDTTKSSKHALDYLKSFNATITAAQPCASLTSLPAGLCSGSPSTFPIPTDSFMQSDSNWVANGGVQDPGVFTMYGGTITGVSSYTTPGSYTGDTSTSITVFFTANSTDTVFAWGGHIASRDDWGLGNSAVAISGSPYHMRILSWFDVSNNTSLNVGNTDRSLSAEAVIFPASITIIKDAVPDDPQDFTFSSTGGLSPANFSLDDDADGTLSNTRTYSGITSFTTYAFTEAAVSGWALSFNNPVCTVTSANGGTQTGNVGTRTVSINLAEGENVTCTFINTKQQGTIIVKKVMIGGTDTFAFTGTPSGSISTNNGTISANVNPGTYTSTETVPAGWDLTSVTCDDSDSTGDVATKTATFNVASNETVTCTFTNEKDANIIVVKQTDPDGDPQIFNFSASYGTSSLLVEQLSVNSAQASPTYAQAILQSGVTYQIEVSGDYGFNNPFTNRRADAECVTEDSWNSNITDQNILDALIVYGSSIGAPRLNSQQNITAQDVNWGPCNTTTHTYTLTVLGNGGNIGFVISDNWEDPGPGCAAFCQNGGTFDNVGSLTVKIYEVGGFSLSDGQSNDSGDLDPGMYSVSEDVPAGWDLTSATCDDGSDPSAINLSAGETVTCTFTNQKDANIVVVKQTDPDGDPTSFEFDPSWGPNFFLSDDQQNDSGNLNPGTYSVSEIVPIDWKLDSTSCVSSNGDNETADNISLQAGETVTCTFFDVKYGVINIIKETNPDGDPTLFDFDVNYGGGDLDLADGGFHGSGGLEPGSYFVIENVPAGWDLISATCDNGDNPSDITLNAGDVVTCTFINEKDANIIVVKETEPDGDPTSFEFDPSWGSNFFLSDGQQNDSGDLDPGNYSVSENVPTGWNLTSATCSDNSDPSSISLQAGETVTCTFTNAKLSINVTKTADPTTLPEPGGPVAFTVRVDNTSTVSVNLTSLQDDVYGNLDGKGTCDVPQTIAAGGYYECTFTENVNGEPGSTHTDTVTATASGVTDSDDATVTITDVTPTILVEKTANPTSVNEPGGNVVFTFKVTNTSAEPVTIASLSDSDFGVLTGDADCQVGTVLPVSGSCEFTQTEVITGDASGPDHENTFTATATDNEGNTATDDDDATVGFDDVAPSVTIVKSADPTTLPEPGGVFTFTLTITNTSVETVEITTLTDDNALSTECTDLIGSFLAPGASTDCSYTVTHTDAGSYPNTASVTVADNEGNPAEDSDSETVTVTDVAPTVTLDKTVDDNEKPEPGGLFTYTLTITNTSVETVEITALTDTNALSQECQDLVGTFLDPGEFVSCQYTATFTDAGTYPNTASVTVEDDEGNEGSDDDSETVTITDVAPTVTINKAVDDNEKPEPGGLFTYTLTITNNSVEDVVITDLGDTQSGATDFSDCAALIGTTLAANGGMASCTYSVTHTDAGVYPNTADVTVADDEGNEASDDDGESVEVTDVAPTVTIDKVVDDNEKPEPGGVFTFTLTITNNSVETVEITALTDDNALSAECQALIGTFLAPGASADCTYTVTHTDAGTYDNTASVTVADNEGNPAEDSDSETVTVTDVLPTVDLTKTAEPTTLPEPGGVFTFTLTITNTSVEDVIITGLGDSNVLSPENSPECLALVGMTLTPGQTVSCEYDITHTDAGSYPNTASVTVADNEGNPAEDSDSETVTVTDVLPTITVEKTANPTSVNEPGGNVVFTFKVTSTSVEPVTIASLSDSDFGALTGDADCQVGTVLPVSGSCEFTQTEVITGDASGPDHENTFTATATDNDGNTATDDDDATVGFDDVLPTVDLVKTASPTTLPEPGGVFTFTLTITNTSVENVTITGLGDSNVLSPENSPECLALVGTTLTPGQTVSCEYDITHTDAGTYPNTASVTVADNEGNPAEDSDSETVTVTDVAPTVTLDKTVDDNEKPEPGGLFTYTLTITNTSVETVEITALTDTNALSAECLALIGTFLDPGEFVSCQYTATFTDAGTYPNTANVTVEDDEGNPATDDDSETITITDVAPTVTIDKAVDDNEKPEPGGLFTYTLTITNTSVETVEITALTDSNALSAQCLALIGTFLAPGEMVSCQYTATFTDAGVYPNTANVTVTDDEGNEGSDDDSETVTVTDVLPTVDLTKTAEPTILPEPGGVFTFTLTITNTSVETVEITALTDDNALSTECQALVGTFLAPGASTDCTYTITHTDAGTYDNTASVTVEDNEGNPAEDSDSETVTVTDVPPTVDLTKTADPLSLPEPGGMFTFTLTITNNSVETVEITALTDDNALSAECQALIGTFLAPGASADCTYTVTHTDAGTYDNTASVTVADNEGNPAEDSDSETVTVTDVAPTVDLVKTAEPTTLPEPGGVFTFTLTITNTSVETVEIIALTDDNALSTECTDLIGTFLTPGASTDCTYTITHTDAGTYDNTASVTVEDNEGNSASDDDSETVTVTDVLPTITVEKVANPTSVSEPGDNVVFTFKVTNTSAEPVTIASLSDSDFGVLTGDADCQVGTVLPVSGSCEFTQTEVITGDASGPDHENTFTATATDNEGNTATDDDDTTVGFDDVLPVISVDKTANPTSVPEAGGTVTFTYTVTNNSVEPVEITSLFDDIFGPQAGDLDCHVGTVLGVGGSCSFSETHFVDGDFENGPAHHNIFTAHAKDNENNDAFDDDDATVEFTDSIADIAIDKVTVDGAFSGDGINILTGESIGWKYTVTNMGNVTLNNVAVTDSQEVAVSCPQTTLAVGESMTCTASGAAITGNYNNTGTAYGDFTDGAGNVESDTATDDSSYFGADPQIAVDKVTVDGATEGDGLNILIGETIGWKYTVTNVGNITLSSVAVTDSQGVTVTCPQTTLAVGESMTCTASGTASEGSYSNTGTASGSYTDGGGHTRTDTATDTSSYFGANPQIDIVKKTVGSDGTEGDNVFVMVGGTVTWKYYVTNTGNVALSSVAVTDSQGVTVTCPQTTLAVGESMTCTATGTNTTPAGTWYNNTGTASGSYTDSAGHTRTATDSDPSAYFSSNPGTVTNSQLCDFGPNFRLVFTPDSRYYTSSYQAYKLSDSNPGQFFYNVFYTNDGSTNTITMEIPYPFVTQGANPVHVYGGLTVNPNNSGTPSPDNLANCFVPTNTLAAYGSIITLSSYTDTNHDGKVGFGDVVLVNVPAEDGFQYINIHLDYGLEKTDGWVKQGSNANTDQTKYPGRANILNLTPHTFKAYADGVLIPGSTDTIYNQNEFKQVRGFGGLVYTWNGSVYVPLVGAKVRLYRGTTLTAANLIETMTADNDGWYLSNYIHKGRAATYTLALLDASGTTIIKTIQVTAGGSLKFGEGLFSLGGPTPNP